MVQKFTDEPLTVCPACDGRLRKVFSPVGIVFKGSGFYRTDSRAGNGAKDGKTSTSEPAPAAAGSTTEGSGAQNGKSDKKPAASSSSSKDSSSGPASTSSGSAGEKVA
jgi:predicted nucleic acid-binding Zn ribbon protein